MVNSWIWFSHELIIPSNSILLSSTAFWQLGRNFQTYFSASVRKNKHRECSWLDRNLNEWFADRENQINFRTFFSLLHCSYKIWQRLIFFIIIFFFSLLQVQLKIRFSQDPGKMSVVTPKKGNFFWTLTRIWPNR